MNMDLYESYKVAERLQEQKLDEGIIQAAQGAINGVKGAAQAAGNKAHQIIGTKKGQALDQQQAQAKQADQQNQQKQQKKQ